MPQRPLDKLSDIFGVLGHPTKLRIFRFLMEHRAESTDPMVPTFVANQLDIPISTTAYNMKVLSRVGLLNRHPSGRYAFYSVNKESIDFIKEFFE